jgi:hypothetical protein
VRALTPVAVALALVAQASNAGADDPDPGTRLVAGAAVLLTGFAIGGTMIAAADGRNAPSSAGWIVMQSGMSLAPLSAHLLSGEWVRGLAFSAPPVVAEGGTVALFAADPGTILHGSLPEQRILWGCFVVGLASSLAGIVDAVWVRPRLGPVAFAPAIGGDRVGLQAGGAL